MPALGGSKLLKSGHFTENHPAFLKMMEKL